MDLVFNSHTRPSGHFTGCTKIKIKKGGRKEETSKHGFRTAERRKVKLALLKILCMFRAIVRTQRKSYTATKDADSSGHRFHCSVSLFLTISPSDRSGPTS